MNRPVYPALLLFLLTAVGVLVAYSQGTLKQSSAPRDAKEYSYKTVEGIDLLLDVFTPPQFDSAKPVPAIIFFHGGGWDHGDKMTMDLACQYFAQRGVVTVTANYRFIDPLINQKKAKMGAAKSLCVSDAKSAIRWVRSHAGELGIDPARVVLGGDSAGTEIALVAALNKDINDPSDDLGISTSALAFVLYNPAFVRPSPSYDEDPRLEPYGYISSGTPPLIMFSGGEDGFKPAADELLADCGKAHVKAEMWIAPGQLHAFTKQSIWMTSACVKADAFLVALGFLKGPPATPPADATYLSPEQYVAFMAQLTGNAKTHP